MKKLALLLALVSPAAFALDFTGIQNWTGTGSNRAAFVLDFKDGSPALAWGFYFSGSVQGTDMLSAIDAADPSLEIDISVNPAFPQFGLQVNGFSYNGRSQSGFDLGSPGYWAYYTAENTTTQPTTWNYSNVGATDRTLADGSWDGWTWAAAPTYASSAPNANIVAAAPVPEPATLAALALGSLAIARRRHRA